MWKDRHKLIKDVGDNKSHDDDVGVKREPVTGALRVVDTAYLEHVGEQQAHTYW